MAFNVVFYTFTKKSNSTARPTGGTTFSCNLKSDSSVVNPRIELNYDGNPSGFNYAYIAHYGRYYYITDWTYTPGIWTATMLTDVLASYKSNIGSANLYVLRSSADFDGYILDTMYPAKLPVTTGMTPLSLTGWATTIGSGSFIIGIVASSSPQLGAVTYYRASGDGLATLINYLYNTGYENAKQDMWDALDDPMYTDLSKLASAQARIADFQARFNTSPIDYIVSCMWVPYSFGAGSETNVQIGYLDTGLKLNKLNDFEHTFPDISFNLVPHPMAASRGAYLNLEPFTHYVLNGWIFGDMDLSAADIGGRSTIKCRVSLDAISGQAHLIVWASGGQGADSFLAQRTVQAGIPISLAQLMVDHSGAATVTAQGLANVLAGTIGTAANIATGNVGGAVVGAANTVVSAISAIDSIEKARTPRLTATGNTAGALMMDLNTRLELYNTFYSIAEEDNANRGRPLMQMRTPASLGGYMMISDGAVPIPGTAGEQAELKSILEAGFYYE